jgi:hypothetical protein
MDKFLEFLLKYFFLPNPQLDLCQNSISFKIQVGKCSFQVSTSFGFYKGVALVRSSEGSKLIFPNIIKNSSWVLGHMSGLQKKSL